MELMTVICLFAAIESLPAEQGAINLQEALRGGLLQTTDVTMDEAQLWAKFWFIILTSLTPREVQVILGMAFGGPAWIKETSMRLNLTELRIRQIYKKARGKLRHPCCLLPLLIEAGIAPRDLSRWGYDPKIWGDSTSYRWLIEHYRLGEFNKT